MRFYDVPAIYVYIYCLSSCCKTTVMLTVRQRALDRYYNIHILFHRIIPNRHTLLYIKYINTHIIHIRARTSFPRSDGASDRLCSKSVAVFRLYSFVVVVIVAVKYVYTHYIALYYHACVIVTCAYFM